MLNGILVTTDALHLFYFLDTNKQTQTLANWDTPSMLQFPDDYLSFIDISCHHQRTMQSSILLSDIGSSNNGSWVDTDYLRRGRVWRWYQQPAGNGWRAVHGMTHYKNDISNRFMQGCHHFVEWHTIFSVYAATQTNIHTPTIHVTFIILWLLSNIQEVLVRMSSLASSLKIKLILVIIHSVFHCQPTFIVIVVVIIIFDFRKKVKLDHIA